MACSSSCPSDSLHAQMENRDGFDFERSSAFPVPRNLKPGSVVRHQLPKHMDIWSACQEGDLNRVISLSSAMSDINAEDEWSNTPLYYASLCGHELVVAFLISVGAQDNAEKRCYRNAANLATRRTLLRGYYVPQAVPNVSKSSLLRDLQVLLRTERTCDISFVFRSHPSTPPARAHLCVLFSRWPWFAERYRPKATSVRFGELPLVGVTPRAFSLFLEWIYCGSFRIDRHAHTDGEIFESELEIVERKCRVDGLLSSYKQKRKEHDRLMAFKQQKEEEEQEGEASATVSRRSRGGGGGGGLLTTMQRFQIAQSPVEQARVLVDPPTRDANSKNDYGDAEQVDEEEEEGSVQSEDSESEQEGEDSVENEFDQNSVAGSEQAFVQLFEGTLNRESSRLDPLCDVVISLRPHSDSLSNSESFFFAHKAILCSRSSYFRVALMGNFALPTSSQDSAVVPPDCAPASAFQRVELDLEDEMTQHSTLRELLRYLYTDQAHIDNANAVDLLVAASRYALKRLQEKCLLHICRSIGPDNAIALLRLADVHGIAKLRTFCVHWVARFAIYLDSSDLSQLDEELRKEIQDAALEIRRQERE